MNNNTRARTRRTKILATLGPASEDPATLDRLIEAGLDCVRVNCSHGDTEQLRARAVAARATGERAGRPLGLLFDLQGPKLRLVPATPTMLVAAGEEVVFSAAGAAGGETDVRVDYDGFGELVTGQSEIVIGDGLPRFTVERIEAGRVFARAVKPGPLAARKGINVTYARPNLPALTEKDVADLALAAEVGAEFVALSFVRTAADVADLRDRLHAAGSQARTIAKIEKVEAYEDLDAILAVADGIMVARGDYGVEAGVAQVPLMQKDAIDRATQVGKLVITATQMLESMIRAPEPTRAEVADVANAVIDGTSAVMLSAETAIGSFPAEAVRAMAEITRAAEVSTNILGRCRQTQEQSPAATVVHAAVELAAELGAAALIIPTSTGGGVRAAVKYRPREPVIALVPDRRVANQLTLEWGVEPLVIPVAETVDDLVELALETVRDGAGLPPGATVVLTAGRRTSTPGATSLIMLREIPPRAV